MFARYQVDHEAELLALIEHREKINTLARTNKSGEFTAVRFLLTPVHIPDSGHSRNLDTIVFLPMLEVTNTVTGGSFLIDIAEADLWLGDGYEGALLQMHQRQGKRVPTFCEVDGCRDYIRLVCQGCGRGLCKVHVLESVFGPDEFQCDMGLTALTSVLPLTTCVMCQQHNSCSTWPVQHQNATTFVTFNLLAIENHGVNKDLLALLKIAFKSPPDDLLDGVGTSTTTICTTTATTTNCYYALHYYL